MAGISIIKKTNANVTADSFKSVLKENAPLDGLSQVVAFESDDIIIGYDSHSSYPIEVFEYNDTLIVFEGRIYNLDNENTKKQIINHIPLFFEKSAQNKAKLGKWLRSLDGDFNILAYDKKNKRLAVINDIFRRLPYYYYSKDDELIISRNLKFVWDFIPNPTFDKLGLAQYLVFFYTLADRTFVDSVKRSNPAMLFTADLTTSTSYSEVVYEFDFSRFENAGKTAKQNAEALSSLFLEGVKNRMGIKKNVISQSGGMDSRTVAAAMVKVGAGVEAVTWKDTFNVSELDTATAQKIANQLGIPCSVLQFRKSIGSDMLALLRLTKAAIKLAIPHHLQYINILKQNYVSDTVFFSGNGGDRIMGHILPHPKYLRNTAGFIDYILNYDGPDITYLGLDNALKLTGISKEVFMQSLHDMLDSYPEKLPADKFIHYNIFCQSFNWHHIGDDRNRNFAWSASPFWSTDFFFYAMNCPQSQKRYMYLYAKLLDIINPCMLKIPYAKNRFKTPISLEKSKSAIHYMGKLLNSYPNPFRFAIKKIKKLISLPITDSPRRYKQIPAIVSCLKQQMSSDAVKKNLSCQELNRLIDDSENFSRETFASLFTVTTLLEYYSTGKSSIESFKEQEFDCYQ